MSKLSLDGVKVCDLKKTTKSPYHGPRASKWKTDSTLLDSILKVESNKLLSVFHLEALGPRYSDFSMQMSWIIYLYRWKGFCLSFEHNVQIFKGEVRCKWKGGICFSIWCVEHFRSVAVWLNFPLKKLFKSRHGIMTLLCHMLHNFPGHMLRLFMAGKLADFDKLGFWRQKQRDLQQHVQVNRATGIYSHVVVVTL